MANVIDSYSESNQNTVAQITPSAYGGGQSLTGNGSALGSVKLYLRKNGSPTHDGNGAFYNGAWNSSSTDRCFYVYDNAGSSTSFNSSWLQFN